MPKPAKDPFCHVSAQEASRSKDNRPALPTNSEASSVYTKHLHLNTGQSNAIDNLYATGEIEEYKFSRKKEQQVTAAAYLSSQRLDPSARELVTNRWSIKWSRNSGKQSRVLYQCDCGSSEDAMKGKTRHIPLPFTVCLVHAEITYEANTTNVLRIRGYFNHNEGCRDASYSDNRPNEPLHPSVLQECLSMLQSGCSLTDIQERNAVKFIARSYKGMPTTTEGLKVVSFCWNFLKSDTQSLYCHFNRLQGIDVTSPAHINVERWLDPQSPIYNKTLDEATFHYKARANRNERFEVCVANAEMRQAAWDIAHKRQMLMDGTFGLCNAKLLLFILMGVDTKNRGVPLAFLFFSAPSENKTTSSGYDHVILQKLLQKWKDALGKQDGNEFAPAVIITDTDTKERKAGLLVFPNTEFILCHFHVRQSWRNNRTRAVRGDSRAHDDIRDQLRSVEAYLLESENYSDAVTFVQQKLAGFDAITDNSGAAAQGKLHLSYFLTYWLASEAFWLDFSRKGRLLAAKRVGCSVDLIVTTTNHLESFNGVLKGKYVQNWKRRGRRLRVDVLLFVMVTSIALALFRKRRIEDEAEEISNAKLQSLPGGAALVKKRNEQMMMVRWKGKRGAYSAAEKPNGRCILFYFSKDVNRDAAVQELMENNQISMPALREQTDGFTFSCYSSRALENDANPTRYTIELLLNGSGSCNCRDFQNRGGACKHLRAALLKLDEAREAAPSIPAISFPTSEEEANALTPIPSCPSSAITVDIEESDPLERALEVVRDTFMSTDDASLTNDGLDCSDGTEFDTVVRDSGAPGLSSPRSSSPINDSEQSTRATTPTIPMPHAQQAIDDQSLLRVLTDLEHDTPKRALHFNILEGIKVGEEFKERIEQVQADMTRYIKLFEGLKTWGQADTAWTTTATTMTEYTCAGPCAPPLDAQPPLSPSAESRKSKKRIYEDILAPSPEKTSSKRHQSYSIH